ncbi:protein kinase [Streptomyces sp. NPDC060064]|uniref:serine/threonine-protein kinase n=1 Tax=Streptomyces sp. NPDC060064 TaxID=3347049 RepID=UPI0036AECF45
MSPAGQPEPADGGDGNRGDSNTSDGGRGEGGSGGGRLIGGRYRLTVPVGSGGMGTVWQARDELVGRDCAVKEPRLPGDPREPSQQRLYERLRREARAAAQVEHPAAVAVHDVVMDGGLPWIVMELIRGESLHERLKRGSLPPAEAARIGLAVAGALGAAHTKGIVHRDVKPANVLLGPHGRVVLTDFGIARIQGEEPLTVSGEFVGSLEFIAPERMSGVTAVPESDLWSLGVLLYAAVEGWSPFRRTTLESTLAAILQAEAPKPVQAGPLAELIVRLLSKVPEHRPSVDEVERELAAVAEGSASTLRPPAPAETESPPTPPETENRPEAAWPGSEVDWPVAGSTGAGRLPGRREAQQAATDDSGPVYADADSDSDSGTVRLGGRTSAPSAAPDPSTPPRPPARARARVALAAIAGAVAVGIAVWAYVPASPDTGNDKRAGASTRTTPPPMETPEAWQTWRPYLESRLDAEISVPSTYTREPVTSEAELAKDKQITFEERGNPVWVELKRAGKAKDTAVQWARGELKWLTDGGPRAGGFTASEAKGTVVPANHHGVDAALLDVTYFAQEGDTARPVHRLAFYVVTEAGERYTVLVEMPKGGREEAAGQDLFRGVRKRLKLGKAETSP